MQMLVQYEQYQGVHDIYVVEGDGATLLSRDWLQRIRLNWNSLGIASVQEASMTLSELLQKYKPVFEEIGEGGAKLSIKSGARTKFCRPRSVPFALREVIERELDQLEGVGVIEKTTHIEWAAPIVVIPKKDGTVRLCGD